MEYVYEETTVYAILFVVAFFASLIDSIAGGWWFVNYTFYAFSGYESTKCISN